MFLYTLYEDKNIFIVDKYIILLIKTLLIVYIDRHLNM